MINRQVAHMARLLDDLLDVSRITRGTIQLHTEPVDLRVAIDQALESSRVYRHEHNHNLIYQRAAEPLWIIGDLTRLEQIPRNLLHNAINYTDDDGHIQISVDQEPSSSQPETMQAILRRRDTGIGLAPEMLPHIFELFTHADHSLARTQGGLGIGLTMVHRLVQMHGGTIEVLSPGTGLVCACSWSRC